MDNKQEYHLSYKTDTKKIIVTKFCTKDCKTNIYKLNKEIKKNYDCNIIIQKLIENKMEVFDDDSGREYIIDFPILQINKLDPEIRLCGGLYIKNTSLGFYLHTLYYNEKNNKVHWEMGTHGGLLSYVNCETEEDGIHNYNKNSKRYVLSKLNII